MKKRKPQSREKWVQVPTKEDTKSYDYYFSNYGHIISVNKITEEEKVLKGSRDQYGFVLLNIRLVKGQRQGFFLHRLIAKEFLRIPAKDKTYIIHIDGDKENNYFKNLKWVNRKELTVHHRVLGVYDNTSARKKHKLTESKVRLIKKRLKSKRTNPKIIARQFNITLPHLRCIERGQYWGHVEI